MCVITASVFISRKLLVSHRHQRVHHVLSKADDTTVHAVVFSSEILNSILRIMFTFIIYYVKAADITTRDGIVQSSPVQSSEILKSILLDCVGISPVVQYSYG
jgi:hypothetical protein